MLPILVLALAGVAGAVGMAPPAAFVCFTDGGSNLHPFQNADWKIKMNWPCKYWALKGQKCGKYMFNLSPGNKWYYPFYQLDTVWLGITDTETGSSWQGRTTNKKAVKYLNAEDKSEAILFTQKGGDLKSDEVFTTNAAWGDGVSITTKDSMAKFTFYPWDPMNTKDYKKAYWRFECFDPDMPENEYPAQMCGSKNFKQVLKDMTVELGLKERFHPITHYYTNFYLHENIVQTEEHCQLAVSNLQQRSCKNDAAQRMRVLSYCAPMLYNTKRTECLSFYNCHPMDAYNSCLKWGCKEDFNPKQTTDDGRTVPSDLCKALSENIYFCPKIQGPGNLSAEAYAANCYKGFVPIPSPEGEPDLYTEY